MQKVSTLTQSPLETIQHAVARAATGAPTPRGRTAATRNGTPPPAPAPAPRELTPEENVLALLLRYPEAALLPEAPAPARFIRSENRIIAETLMAYVGASGESAGGELGPAVIDKEQLRAALDPALQEQYDFLLARTESEPPFYPYTLAGELNRRVFRLSEDEDRQWTQQCSLLLAEAQINGDKETIDRLTPVLDQIRSRLMLYTPARSTVFRDSRD
jgi:hypothetical protein